MEADEDREPVYLDTDDEEADLAAGVEELMASLEFGDITGGEDVVVEVEGVPVVLRCEELDTNDPEQALFKAAKEGDVVTVRKCLDQGVPVDGYGFHRLGWSPLISAIKAEQIETIKVLLERGASLDLVTDGETTPYEYVMAKANDNLMMWAVVTGYALQLRLNDAILGYIEKSDHFYRSAKMLADNEIYDVACFLCHQAAEMALHACTRLNGRSVRTHQLDDLLQNCAPALANKSKLLQSAAWNMQEHYIYSRYPADRGFIIRFWDYTRYKADMALQQATDIRNAVRRAVLIHYDEQNPTNS